MVVSTVAAAPPPTGRGAEQKFGTSSENMSLPRKSSNNNADSDHHDGQFEIALDDSDDRHLDNGAPEKDEPAIKCSAVHTLERDMPDYDYSHLVRELRDKMLHEYEANPGIYSLADVEKLRTDDWFVSRFLLRQKMDVPAAFDMFRRALRFRHESLTNSIRREDFPAEFYQLGGLFGYEPDRKGNKMLYLRVKKHRKTPEIQTIVQAFLYYNIKRLDEEADGKGIAIVFDCTGGGLVNADMDLLMFLVSSLVNYFPKGLSYLLVHELPWLLKPIWHIVKNWISEEHRQLIKFSNSRTIFEYVDRENLPDFMGGTCERDYQSVPENCTTLDQAAKLWGVEKHCVKKILLRFAEYLPPESLAKALEQCDTSDEGSDSTPNNSDQENEPHE